MIFEKNISKEKENLYFFFSGNPKSNDIDRSNLNQLIDKIFNNYYFGNDLVGIVKYLRTIFKDYEEKLLTVKISNENCNSCVRFYDIKLVEYSKIEIIHKRENSEDKIKFNYVEEGEIEFSYSDKSNKYDEYLITEKIKEFVSKELDYLYRLKHNAGPVFLDRDGKCIITLYNLFYGELPDLSDLCVESKLQNMLYILSEYGITVEITGEEVYFSKYYKYPESMVLRNWLMKLIPIASNVETLDILRLKKESVEIIKLVGEEIRKCFSNNCNNLSFERFCYAVYCKNYSYVSNIPLKEMAGKMSNKYFGEFSEEELKYYFELKEKINQKYDNMLKE